MFLLFLVIFAMAALSELCAAVKFLLEKNAAETFFLLITAYKDNSLGKTQVYEWFSHFKIG